MLSGAYHRYATHPHTHIRKNFVYSNDKISKYFNWHPHTPLPVVGIHTISLKIHWTIVFFLIHSVVPTENFEMKLKLFTIYTYAIHSMALANNHHHQFGCMCVCDIVTVGQLKGHFHRIGMSGDMRYNRCMRLCGDIKWNLDEARSSTVNHRRWQGRGCRRE